MANLTYISRHFSSTEVERSAVAARCLIDNSLPDELLDAVRYVAQNVLEPIRSHYAVPFSPSSWYRSPELDAAIRGKQVLDDYHVGKWRPKSQHCMGEAVDINVPGVTTAGLALQVHHLKIPYDQLLLEFVRPGEPMSGWVHVSAVEKGEPRGEILSIGVGGARALSSDDLKRLAEGE